MLSETEELEDKSLPGTSISKIDKKKIRLYLQTLRFTQWQRLPALALVLPLSQLARFPLAGHTNVFFKYFFNFYFWKDEKDLNKNRVALTSEWTSL